MGIYDQLSQLDKTSTVTAPEPARTAEEPPTPLVDVSASQQAVKKLTAPKQQRQKTRMNPTPQSHERVANHHRVLMRVAFDVFQDQMQILREESLQAKLLGEKLSMNEMVREALDSYLTDKNFA